MRQFNPWWQGNKYPDIPKWKRSIFGNIIKEIKAPSGGRAILLSGARQVGKTTLFLQTIQHLLEENCPSTNILYLTMDHPLLRTAGLDHLLQLWRDYEIPAEGPEYIFLDEIHQVDGWQTWLKLQVDFQKKRHIAVTGSSTPLLREGQESGVGRWQTIHLSTLSFYEYLQIRERPVPPISRVQNLLDLFGWSPQQLVQLAQSSTPLTGWFHEYLLRGGFPQSAFIENLLTVQNNLREDILDKILKRDMTSLFGVRRVFELEQLFLYFCLHEGGIIDYPTLCRNLQLKRPTINHFIDLLETSYLIHRLMPYGYGKEVLRGKPKIYLVDPAIAPGMLLKGKNTLTDNTEMGLRVESALLKHLNSCYQMAGGRFSYWQGRQGHEVDFIMHLAGRYIPIEVKYQTQKTITHDLKGLCEFVSRYSLKQGLVITRELTDIGLMEEPVASRDLSILKIPAPIACYLLGQSQLQESLSAREI